MSASLIDTWTNERMINFSLFLIIHIVMNIYENNY
mgnify:CR=1 FL=1